MTIPDAVREYLSQLGKKKKRITPADSRARSARLAKLALKNARPD